MLEQIISIVVILLISYIINLLIDKFIKKVMDKKNNKNLKTILIFFDFSNNKKGDAGSDAPFFHSR